MDHAGMQYLRRDNCLPWVEDFPRAQRLLDRQQKAAWPKLLNGLARELNPVHSQMLGHFHVDYYWSVFQSEWAIDVVFREADLLRRLYPKIVHHAMTTLGSQDVLRFLGRFVPASSAVPRRFSGEVLSDLKPPKPVAESSQRFSRQPGPPSPNSPLWLLEIVAEREGIRG